jgi:phosphoserine aminotransferase
MFTTPSTLAVYGCLQTLIWLKAQGGIEGLEKLNKAKAELLYAEIDRNSLFAANIPNPADRSRMNVTFVMAEGAKDFEKEFGAFAKSKGMLGLEGHRSVGGFRASLYNAMPIESVQALVDVMQEFEQQKKA